MTGETITTLGCKDVGLYFTEFSRNQLAGFERDAVVGHLEECKRCRLENEMFKNLSVELDKVIPSVTEEYKTTVAKEIFIETKQESMFIKVLSALVIAGILLLIFAADFSEKNDLYPGLIELKNRAENVFFIEPGLKID